MSQTREGMAKQNVDPLPGVELLQPDTAAVLLHHALTDRQSDAASRVLISAVQAVEEPENLVRILLFNANPVIGDREQIPAFLLIGCNMDTRRLLTVVLNRVADQVLKKLRKPAFMDRDSR